MRHTGIVAEVSKGPTTPGLTSAPTRPSVAKGARLAWLDALRGIAALCVVFDHLGYHVLEHARHLVYNWFDPGAFGVFVFFVISGYIVPASLERKGSVRTFWVSRLFRLYPLYLFVMGSAVVLWYFHLGSLRGAGNTPETSVIGSALMIPSVLGTPNAVNVIWSLAFEMTFYLLLTALFVTGVHRRSSTYALIFAVASVALGGILPVTAISNSFLGARLVAMLADLAVAVGIALAVTRFRIPKAVGAVMAGGVALLLISVNSQWVRPWEAFMIMALMFTGTVIYRAERGEIAKWHAAGVVAVVGALVLAAGVLYNNYQFRSGRVYAITMLVAAATFAVGLACRRRKVPAFLAWLGLVSYSVYLVHPLLVELYGHIPATHGPHSLPIQVGLAGAFVAVLLACCALTHLFIEAPAQRLGKKVSTALDRRFGPERAAVQEAPRPSQRPPAAYDATGASR